MSDAAPPGGRARSWFARFEILRMRNLRFVFASTLVSSLGDGIVGVAIAFAVLDLTHSATDLGIVMAVRTVTTIATTLFGGVLADRISRRTVMMTADVARFGGQIAIGVLLAVHAATVLEIVLSQALVSAGNGFFEPASMGMIQAAAGEHKQEANALKVISMSSTGMIGPAIGGALVATVGSSYALMADGASYLLSAIFLFQVGGTARAALQRDVEAPTFLADMRGGFHEVSSRPWVWATILNMAVGNLLMAAFPVLGPLVCKQHYGGAPAWAALSVAFAVGMFAGGGLLLRVTPRFPMRVGFMFSIPLTIPMILLGIRAPIVLVAASQFVAGAGGTMLNALWWTSMQEHIPANAISRVSSYDWAGTLAVMPVGYALIGPLAGAVGSESALIACGAAATAVTASGLLVPAIRHLRASPGADAATAAEEGITVV